MTKIIRIGLIGAGRWGPNLIGSLRRIEGVEIKHVADQSKEAIQKIVKRFDCIIPHEDPQSLIGQNELDAVLIATPVETHFSLAKEVLNSGKNVFVEKPFGQSIKECNILLKLAKKNELQIMVGHVFLFNASILALKKVLDSGDLGKIMHLEAHRTNLGPVRKDVNAVWDLTSHDLSIFDFLLDDLPESVSCLGSCKLDEKVEDTSYTTFKYPKNILAHAHASWLNPRKVRQITVIGDRKMAIWDDLNLEHPIMIYDSSIGLEQSYYSDSFASHRLSYNRGAVVLPPISTNEPLLEEMNHFIKVLRGGVENRCSGKYATEVVKSLVHADQSLQSRGVFIKIKR